jgi:transcriptional regulator with XRE-family HTH domain
MTQRELAEKLFVSDKTVSRWECDECSPDLSLIPAIAEIFGITTDELLRGEKNNTMTNVESDALKQKAKGDKQFKAMLYNRFVRYKNLTMISVGLIALALISAMIFNLGLLRGMVGFCVASVFLVSSVICQICFASSAHLPMDEDETYCKSIRRSNADVVLKALNVCTGACVMFAFILPLACIGNAYAGLTFDSWLITGGICALIALISSHITYVFAVRKMLIKKEILSFSDIENERHSYQKQLLKRFLAMSVSIAILLYAAIFYLDSVDVTAFASKCEFTDSDNWDAFKKFMKEGKAYVTSESGFFVDVYEEPVSPDGEKTPYSIHYLYDKNGNESVSFECYSAFYSRIDYISFNEDGSPQKIAVYTSKAISDARRIITVIETTIGVMLVLDLTGFSLAYIIKTKKGK